MSGSRHRFLFVKNVEFFLFGLTRLLASPTEKRNRQGHRIGFHRDMNWQWEHIVLYIVVPVLFVSTVLYGLFFADEKKPTDKKYRVRFKLKNSRFNIDNIRRGASIIGLAGSGKTESVIYNFLLHFSKHGFCGVIHDYKDFELTEIAYPLFREKNIKFYTIAFDQIHYRVNPIAPRYLPNEESVNEVSRVLMENLLEQNLSENSGSNKFFSDAVEGLLSGIEGFPIFEDLPVFVQRLN